MATKVYKRLFLIWIIFGLWQLHIDLESALHRFLLLESKEKKQFPLGHTFLISEEKQRWLNEISLYTSDKACLLCSYSLVKASPTKQAEWCHWSTEVTIQGKSLQFTWQQVEIYNSCIKKDRVLAIIKNKPQ